MTVLYSVKIQGHIHEVRVSVPSTHIEEDLIELKSFAVITACLERAGYLPQGTVHAVE